VAEILERKIGNTYARRDLFERSLLSKVLSWGTEFEAGLTTDREGKGPKTIGVPKKSYISGFLGRKTPLDKSPWPKKAL